MMGIEKIAGTTLAVGTNQHHIVANASGQTFTLPASPDEGDFFFIKNNDADSATCTISGNGNNIDGQASVTLDVPNAAVKCVFDSVTGEWFIY